MDSKDIQDRSTPPTIYCKAPKCMLVQGHGGKHATSKEAAMAGDFFEDYRPITSKIEWNITYSCNLECACCNRGSFLQKPHTPNMTIDDALDYFRQAREIEFEPFVLVIVGGEPTMHPDFMEFCRVARENHKGEVWVISNGNISRSRELCEKARAKYSVSLHYDAYKVESITRKNHEAFTYQWNWDMFLSPTDYGEPLRDVCYTHCSTLCGISLDAGGYSPCALGGAVDALLGLNVRTRNLADLFDKEKIAEMTRALCAHCGFSMMGQRHPDLVKEADTRFGTPMSPTWLKAFEGRK